MTHFDLLTLEVGLHDKVTINFGYCLQDHIIS